MRVHFFQIPVLLCLLIVDSASAQKKNVIEIDLKVDKKVIEVGQATQLRAIASQNLAKEVRAFYFYVRRVGYFDETHGMALDDLIPVVRNLDESFPGLSTSICPHGVLYKPEGLPHKVIPNRIGIFMVTTRWVLENSDIVASNPVVITVRPPVDKKGVAILKQEWLEN